MKIIFLDIDGVLNSTRSVIVRIGPTFAISEKVRELAVLDAADFYDRLPDGTYDIKDDSGLSYGVREGLNTIDPVCVALVNRLLDADHEIGLVLSSTHRRSLTNSRVSYGSDEHLRRLRLYLEAMGLKVPAFFSITPTLHKERGVEIDTWLNQAYENCVVVDDDAYVILDDTSDMLDGQPLVLINPEHGMDFANYAEACKHLRLAEPGLILI